MLVSKHISPSKRRGCTRKDLRNLLQSLVSAKTETRSASTCTGYPAGITLSFSILAENEKKVSARQRDVGALSHVLSLIIHQAISCIELHLSCCSNLEKTIIYWYTSINLFQSKIRTLVITFVLFCLCLSTTIRGGQGYPPSLNEGDEN